jgi:hypothetical protein
MSVGLFHPRLNQITLAGSRFHPLLRQQACAVPSKTSLSKPLNLMESQKVMRFFVGV